MRMSTRIFGTIAAGTLALGIGLGAVPAGATPQGPDTEIADPPPCTHGCTGDPGPAGPDDLATPPADPGDPGGGDVPIPADATFTG